MAVNSLTNNSTSDGYYALSEENKTFYDRTLLKRLLPQLVFAKYGQKKTMKKGEGNKINFRRFDSLPAATTPLTEGVTPEGRQLTVTPVEATLKQYGDYIEITDVLDMVGIDPVATENSELLGEQAGLTIDTVVRDEVMLGTNVYYCGASEDVDDEELTATAAATHDDIAKIVRFLRMMNAKPMADGHYLGIIDPYIAYDIMKDPLWQDVSKYSGGKKIMDGEIGSLAGVRFIETSNTKQEGGIHSGLIFGQDAYGVVDLEGSATNKPGIIIKPLGSGGTTDPLNQRGTQGWKAMFATVRLNESAMVRLETKVSE